MGLCCHVCLWLLLNSLLLRPLFAWLDVLLLLPWKCSQPLLNARAREGYGRGPAVGGGASFVKENGTGLEVVVAGAGHCGTTSLQAALEDLGLNTFHADEVHFYVPELQIPGVAAQELPAQLRPCSVDAYVIEPWLELTEALLQASPGAKVLLVTRDWQQWTEAWRHQSDCMLPQLLRQIAAAYGLCHWLPQSLPLALLPERWRQRGGFVRPSLTSLYLESCLLYTGFWKTAHGIFPSREPAMKHDMLRSERAYSAYAARIRQLVPPEQLLEFDVRKHGWKELAAFLGRAAPKGPFPRLRTKGHCTALWARWQAAPLTFMAFWLLLLASIAVNWRAYRWLAFRAARACAAREKAH